MKCLQGASALNRILTAVPGSKWKVFVVWERVLESDWGSPSSAVLSRLNDPRVVQFWDPGRAVSRNLGETSFKTKVWDWIAIYPPGTRWEGVLPKPAYSGRPVEDVADAVAHELKGASAAP